LSLGAPITLVHAPRGFGKTLAVVQWLREHALRSGVRCHWLDPRFRPAPSADYWQVIGPAPDDVELGPSAGSVGWHALGLAETTPVLLVIDGAEALLDGDLLAEVVELAARYDYFRAVVISRTRDVLGLEESHRVDVIEIDDSLLRFTAEETAQVFAARGVAPTDPRSEGTHDDLGGWPTLIGRAASHLTDTPIDEPLDPVTATRRRREFTQMTVDYLADTFLEEVLTPELIGPATRAAALTEVTPATLSFALGTEEEGDRAYQELRRAGLLTQIGSAARLPELIRKALLLGWPADGSRQSLQRAVVDHHLAREEYRQAFEQAATIGDPDFLAAVVARHWFWVYLTRTPLLEAVLEQLPDEVLARNPAAAAVNEVVRGRSVGDHGEWSLVGSDAALARIGASSSAPEVVSDAVTKMIADRVMGRLPAAARLATKLLVVIGSPDAARNKDLEPLIPTVLVQCATSLQLVNELQRAAALMTRAHALAVADPSGLVARSAEGGLAMTNILLGHVATARDWLRRHRRHPPYPGVMGSRVDTAAQVADLLIALEDGDVARGGALAEQLGRVPGNLAVAAETRRLRWSNLAG